MTTTTRDTTDDAEQDGHQKVSDRNDGRAALDRQFIAGTWRDGRAGRSAADTDPYTGQTLVEIPLADERDLDEAYAAARSAQRAWAAKLPMERAGVMSRAAAVMETRKDEIIDWLIREAGSTRVKATMEWSTVNAVMLEAARQAYGKDGFILPADVPDKEARVYRRPVGVVGVISPWNWPLQLSNRSVAPALAVGNAVVLKPASDTPVTGGLLLASIFEQAGLPPGVLSVVVGGGRDIGDAFVRHPIPRVISFTGSTPVGRGIVRQTADSPTLKRVELELGGNSPLVILDDADLDLAVNAAVFGRFLHQGQICMSTNRVIVDDAIHDDFVDAFAERVRSLKVGNPDEPDTAVGPVINQRQLDGHLRRIAAAGSSGARQLVGGEPDGLVLPPHVFTDISEDHEIVREETFGPIAPILRARDEEDALRLANGTEYGLSSAVFTTDEERGVRFARRIEVGMSHVNDQTVNDLPNNPFGGEKNSGFGRFGGEWATMAFTTDQWVTIQHERRPYPFDAGAEGAGLPAAGG